MYRAFIINTSIVLGTLQDMLPTQYDLLFPMFWIDIITIATKEITKYTRAGVHNSFSFLGNAILCIIYRKKLF
jgi:hypothetical protein